MRHVKWDIKWDIKWDSERLVYDLEESRSFFVRLSSFPEEWFELESFCLVSKGNVEGVLSGLGSLRLFLRRGYSLWFSQEDKTYYLMDNDLGYYYEDALWKDLGDSLCDFIRKEKGEGYSLLFSKKTLSSLSTQRCSFQMEGDRVYCSESRIFVGKVYKRSILRRRDEEDEI